MKSCELLRTRHSFMAGPGAMYQRQYQYHYVTYSNPCLSNKTCLPNRSRSAKEARTILGHPYLYIHTNIPALNFSLLHSVSGFLPYTICLICQFKWPVGLRD